MWALESKSPLFVFQFLLGFFGVTGMGGFGWYSILSIPFRILRIALLTSEKGVEENFQFLLGFFTITVSANQTMYYYTFNSF